MSVFRCTLVVAVVAASAPAAAEPKFVDSDSEWALVVPRACSGLVPQPPQTPRYWDRWLSLAACLQNSSLSDVSDPDDLQLMVKEQMLALAPSMILYREALEHGPARTQLHAAYHVGLASIAMMTRARSSIHGPREHELRAKLEPLLEPAKQIARVSLGAVINEALKDPTLAIDPVSRYMVRSAHLLLRALIEPHELQRLDIATRNAR